MVPNTLVSSWKWKWKILNYIACLWDPEKVTCAISRQLSHGLSASISALKKICDRQVRGEDSRLSQGAGTVFNVLRELDSSVEQSFPLIKKKTRNTKIKQHTYVNRDDMTILLLPAKSGITLTICVQYCLTCKMNEVIMWRTIITQCFFNLMKCSACSK